MNREMYTHGRPCTRGEMGIRADRTRTSRINANDARSDAQGRCTQALDVGHHAGALVVRHVVLLEIALDVFELRRSA